MISAVTSYAIDFERRTEANYVMPALPLTCFGRGCPVGGNTRMLERSLL